jgi:hypothetical protein
MSTHVSGVIITDGGIQVGELGSTGSYDQVFKQVTAIVDATATDILTITVPNQNCGAGGRVLCSSTITQASHIGDSTRTVEYIWSVTRLAGAIAVITISIITGGTVIATKASGYTLTSTIAATAVTGGATAINTFTFQVTNTGSTASTTAATVFAEILNYSGTAQAIGASASTGITIS